MARFSTGLLSLLAVICLTATAVGQQQRHPWIQPLTEESQPDVFYNLYQPGNGGMPAAAFPAPLPTPPVVGHVYYTYQPFMPNEWMYAHHRTYHQSYNNGMGLNRTKVLWHGTPLRTELMNIRKFFSVAR
jgi:hypothetical protein